MEFRILAPLEVRRDGGVVALGGSKPRAVLAVLLLHSNQAVSVERLAMALWGEDAPPGAVKTVQVHVSRLRRALADDDVLVTTPAGYRLRVGPGELDAEHFERLAAEGRHDLAAGRPESAAARLREALACWRGPALAELAAEPFAAAEIARLEEERLGTVEARVEADLASGRHAELIGELRRLVGEHPLRERLRAQLMLALYRAGRQADALDAYASARAALVDELGIEPAAELRELQQAILRQEASLQLAPTDHARPSRPPVPMTRLIGRDQERHALTQLLVARDVRLVTLVGPGGVGKTRLALAVLDGLDAAFPDGVHWVELAGVARPEHVAPTIAHALGVTPLRGESSEDALVRFLQPKGLLLAIDNWEHVLAAAPVLARALSRCPGLTVLATSREALGLRAEHRVPVPPLAAPTPGERVTSRVVEQAAATALFLDAARRHGSPIELTEANVRAVVDICTRLDGLPLALELAAARVALLGPLQLAARLEAMLPDLGGGARDAPDRQRTLRATIDWSYRLLDGRERDAFVRFATFAGGADVDAAEAVTGAPLDVLAGLLGKHLLQQVEGEQEPRLRMLDTVRAFALEQLAEHPDAARAHRRHGHHFVALAERAVGGMRTHAEPQWLARLDRETDNVRAALGWFLADEPDTALHLAAVLGEYWELRGRSAEGLRWLDAALERAGSTGDVIDRVRAHVARGNLLRFGDDVAAAEAAWEHAYRLAEDADVDAARIEALIAVAGAALRVDRVRRARIRAEEAVRRARALGDERLLAEAVSFLAAATPPYEHGPLYEEAVGRLARRGHVRGLAELHSGLSYSAINEGRYGDALVLLDRALPLAEAAGHWFQLAMVAGNLGLAGLFSGDLERAHDAFARQLRLCGQHVFRSRAAEGLGGMAAIAAARGDADRAARLLGAGGACGEVGSSAVVAELDHRFFAAARARAGPAAWASSQARGARMSFDEAIRYALEEPSKPLR